MSQFVLQLYLHIENVIPSVLEMYYIKKSTTFLLVVFFAAVHRQFMAFFSRKTF